MWRILVTLLLFHCLESAASLTMNLPVIHNTTLQVANANSTVINGTCGACLCTMFFNSTLFSAFNCFRNNQTCQIFFRSWNSSTFMLTTHLTTSVYLLTLPPESSTLTSASVEETTARSTMMSTTNQGITTAMTSTTRFTTSTTTTTTGMTTLANVGVSSDSGPYYGWERITFSCVGTLTNLLVTITAQKTVGATSNGAYTTLWGGTFAQTVVDNGVQIIYTWTVANGQTVTCSSGPYTFVAQLTLSTTLQITSADTYSVVATTSTGTTRTSAGHF